MPISFDKRTGLRILNAVKLIEGASPHNVRRPMNPKRPGGRPASATIEGALAIIKGTVPASSGIDVTGTLTSSSVVITLGVLDVTATADTFSAGALLITPEGKPIFVGENLRAVPVVNPSYTNFIGEGDGVGVAGTLYLCDPAITIGETEYTEFFLLPWPDLRGLPGYAEGTAPSGDDDPDLQIVYHSGGEDSFKLDSEDCAAEAE